MYIKKTTVTHIFGLDTGLISYIVRTARLFKSKIYIEHEGSGIKADARDTIELHKISSPYGTEIRIIAEGEDEKRAADVLFDLFTLFKDKKLYENTAEDNEIEMSFRLLLEDVVKRI
ncbi:MAG: HPr family phosphocarrier protein [Spirochaetales bacterium]|nr:HPr family phosphocarrier protein [Spirochaetales bacterium]